MAGGSLRLHKIKVEQHLRRILSGTDGPTGIQWFVDIRFGEPNWSRDRTRVRALIDGLASTSWFREFDVFAPAHKPGTPFKGLDEVRDSVASEEPSVAIFAHGEPRMTVDIDEAEAALALDFTTQMLELRLWFGPRPVAQYKAAVLGDIIALLVALRDAWPDALVAKALAFPHPTSALRYRRTRPLRLAGRALDAVVDMIDRGVPSDGPPWASQAKAMADAPVPSGVARIERGRLVVNRWIDDPSDPRAMAEACSRHEQWLVGVVPTRLAPGWNEAGDLEIVDEPKLVEVTSKDVATWGKPRSDGREVAVVAASRSDALALAEPARAVGFARVVYRDPSGKLWNPRPPGDWVTER